MSLATSSLRTMSLGTIVPRDNCSTRQLFLSTIVPLDNCSSRQLFLATINPPFLYKEDGPPNDQNQGDGGAQIVANDHPYNPASSVLLRSFANDHLQRGRFSGWPKSRGRRRWSCCKWSSGESSVPLQMVFCKEDCPSDGQNQRDGGARIVANDHLDDPASYVPLQRVICKEDGPPDDQHFLVEWGWNWHQTCP